MSTISNTRSISNLRAAYYYYYSNAKNVHVEGYKFTLEILNITQRSYNATAIPTIPGSPMG